MLTKSIKKTDNLLDSIFKNRYPINYDSPILEYENISYINKEINIVERKYEFDFFYKNYFIYNEMEFFFKENNLKFNSYIIKEIDKKNKIVLSHIQFFF